MSATAQRIASSELAEWRAERSAEVGAQIVHHQIHRRPGWLEDWVLQIDGRACGYASVAVAGPWTDRRTLLEFYMAPGFRHRTFELFETLLEASRADSFELQSNVGLEGVLPHVFGKDVVSEKIVFSDGPAPDRHAPEARLQPVTPDPVIREAMAQRAGGGEWTVERHGKTVGRGGLLFHYNLPYGDVWMEIEEPHRRQGLGAWLVQQLIQEARRLGATPAARCNPDTIASRRTLQRAGFIPVGHILIGRFSQRETSSAKPQPAP